MSRAASVVEGRGHVQSKHRGCTEIRSRGVRGVSLGAGPWEGLICQLYSRMQTDPARLGKGELVLEGLGEASQSNFLIEQMEKLRLRTDR